jgi:cobalt-precorrin 5A hydrolase
LYERGAAIVALTKWGVSTAEKISKALDRAQIKHSIYAPTELCSDRIKPFNESLDRLFANLFDDVDAIIPVMTVGIVVRSLGPLTINKKTDPAVVVVDDIGKYAISLLSGHIRGANKLAKIVASGIGAESIITTATELLGKKCVEEIAEEYNLDIVNFETLVRVNSAIVNEKKVLIVTIGDVAFPKIKMKNTDIKPVSNVDQIKEMMQGYDAGIVIAVNPLSLGELAKPVVILTAGR